MIVKSIPYMVESKLAYTREWTYLLEVSLSHLAT